ncbi:MAG UNVERIFIED_CONTAM: hypothetical protein LVR18_29985 [Planctomycetaceae bacterium]|jgi:hypothetical protein
MLTHPRFFLRGYHIGMLELRNPHSILAAIHRRPLRREIAPTPVPAAPNRGMPSSVSLDRNPSRSPSARRTTADIQVPAVKPSEPAQVLAIIEPPSPIPLEQLLQPGDSAAASGWRSIKSRILKILEHSFVSQASSVCAVSC